MPFIILAFKDSFPLSMTSDPVKNSIIIQFLVPLNVKCEFFALAVCKIFSLCFIFISLYMISSIFCICHNKFIELLLCLSSNIRNYHLLFLQILFLSLSFPPPFMEPLFTRKSELKLVPPVSSILFTSFFFSEVFSVHHTECVFIVASNSLKFGTSLLLLILKSNDFFRYHIFQVFFDSF